jgi:type IX secretion system PorP/SprF family membrane protein
MIRKLYIFVFIPVLFLTNKLGAQHYQFSQFYAAPTYLNPAFTGANACSRVALNYRNQWNAIPGTFTTYQVTADHSLKKYNSGIGIQFFSDKAGIGSLKTNQVNLLYAYEMKIGKLYGARAGLSVGMVQRSIDYSTLTFGDQIARGGASQTLDDIAVTKRFYPDMAAGVLFFNPDAWAGFSFNHLNRPDQSLQGNTTRLPLEFKLHGGYKFTFDDDESSGSKKNPIRNNITITGNYKKQAKFNQIDLGFYYSKNYFVLGLWYRGIPLFRPVPEYRNNDALVLLVGVVVEKFRIGYSYDVTLSKLTNVSTAGTHEISLSYQFCNPKKKKKKNILISCPKF